MNKFNKTLSIILVVAFLITGLAIIVPAATGESVVVLIHRYFVDDVEVTEDEYNTVPTTKYITVEHRKNTETEYVTATERVITAADLTPYNIGSLGDYLNFETDYAGNVYRATIKSDKVVAVKYDFGWIDENTPRAYCSYFTQEADGNYMNFTSAALYQEFDCNGLHVTSGIPTITGYKVCEADYTLTCDTGVDYVLFYLTTPANTSPITFDDCFRSITLYVAE